MGNTQSESSNSKLCFCGSTVDKDSDCLLGCNQGQNLIMKMMLQVK